MIKTCCISDTHGMEDQLTMPSGDLLIHAGDITSIGELDQLEKFNAWIKGLDFEKKVVIPGNHDRTFRSDPAAKRILTNCDLLLDSETTFAGLKIYGSPWSPWFGGHYWAYNAHRGPDILKIWNKIPYGTDILVTHSPPFGVLDNVPRTTQGQGCKDLLATVKRIRPKLHVFGHLHDNHGERFMFGSNIMFVNATTCNEAYEPINPPIVVEVETK